MQQDEVVVGDKITFNISATNTGNWPLVNLQVTDTIIDSRGNNQEALTSLVTIVSDNGVAVDSSTFDGELAVDQTVVYKVQYTVLDSSSIAPIILNSATVSGDAMTDLDGDGTYELFGTTTDISDDGLTGDDDTGDDPTKVYLAPNPIIEVIKTVSSIKGSDQEGWFVAYGENAETEVDSPTTSSFTNSYGPLYYGKKLAKGNEFVWTQNHMPNNSNRWFSIGVWDGATDNHNNLAQLV